MRLKNYIWLPLTFICSSLFSQEKSVQAIKTEHAPKIDGSLDEAVWATAQSLTGFIQNYPNTGQPATAKSDVRILYDNSAIYIGAYLYDNPANIRKQLTSRDDEGQKDVDYFSVFFDTYNDHQNGFEFLVTTMNVQTDAKLGPNYSGNFGDFGDKSWDAVWESKTSIKNDGWVVEMRIPYISLRFAKKDVQDWGLQLLRFTRNNNESCFWNPFKPDINGFINQFGELKGLKNITPPLRLSFSPYITTGYRSSPVGNTYVNEWLRNGGMDVKYGINESFTLDATLIPDFGQVVSDNVVNNLTPFEVKFVDNRPFFTEGIELFNKAGLFYSRRVGGTPSGYNMVNNFVLANPDWKIIKNPSSTQLYNAIKFSGRNKYKLGIGIFNAVAAPMKAKIKNRITDKDSTISTSVLSNYNIIVLDQALKGRSSVTFTNTSVLRNGSARDANVTALDFSFYDKTNHFNVRGSGKYSKLFTTNGKDGYSATLKAGKVSGLWQYNVTGQVESAFYNPNDLGIITSPNEVSLNGTIAYKQFKPANNFINYNYSLTAKYNRLYKPAAYGYFNPEASAFWLFKNFWDVGLNIGFFATQHDYFVLGNPATYGRFVKRPSYGYAEIEGSTDSRKKLYFNYDVLFADFFNSANNKNYHNAEAGITYRFSDKFTLELSHSHEGETDYIISAGREINGEPIIAFVDFTDEESVLGGTYNFTPRVNLTLRARHYLSRVKFNRFANVDAKGNPLPRGGTDSFDNVNYFNFDSFFTWDFRLGSKLVIGYKNWLGDDEIINPAGNNSYLRNLKGIFDRSHGNEITVRFIYFLDYNQLRKKR